MTSKLVCHADTCLPSLRGLGFPEILCPVSSLWVLNPPMAPSILGAKPKVLVAPSHDLSSSLLLLPDPPGKWEIGAHHRDVNSQEMSHILEEDGPGHEVQGASSVFTEVKYMSQR